MSPPQAPAGPGPAELALRQQHAGRSVLVVEDNLVNQEVAAALLQAVGLVVEIAENGALGVERVLSHAYDLVLMDVQMPVMDGVQATQAIRQRVGEHPPIIAVTALAFREDKARFLAAGMNDHLPKPIDPELLYGTVLRWLSPPIPLAPATPPASPEAAAASQRALLERLASVEGFDPTHVLRNVGDRLPMLERVLASFAASYLDGDAALAANDPAAWQVACHSLRGSSATLGASSVLQSLNVFERSLRAGAEVSDLERQARHLDQQLRTLAARLKAALEP